MKGYGVLAFAKNIGKNIGKNISKNLSCKCCQEILEDDKQSATNVLKTASKRGIDKQQEQLVILISKIIADEIIKVSKRLPQTS